MVKRGSFVLLVLLLTLSSHASQLDIKTFPSTSNYWILSDQGLLNYATETRSVKLSSLNEYGTPDSIADVVENEGLLWISDKQGLFKVDIQTQTRELVPFPGGSVHTGKVTVDFDYAWLATTDSLYRYDKLANEWFVYALGENNEHRGQVMGLASNGTELFCATPNGMHVFSIADEKWYFYPVKKEPLPAEARYFVDPDAMVFVYGSNLVRYIFKSQSWDLVDVGAPILDIDRSNAKETIILTADKVYKYDIEKNIKQPLDIIGLKGATAVGRKDTLVFVSTPDRVIEFNLTAKSMDFIKSPPGMENFTAQKFISSAEPLIILMDKAIGVCYKSNDSWEILSLAKIGSGAERITWDDNGLTMRWGEGVKTQLTGYTGVTKLDMTSEWGSDTNQVLDDSGRVVFDTTGKPITTIAKDYDPEKLMFKWKVRNPDLPPPFNIYDRANLTLHTTLGENRYLDFTFNNDLLNQVPRKEILYRGDNADNVHTIKVGTNNFTASQNPLLPETMYEGAMAIVESKSRLESRDRKIVRSTSGIGLKSSVTRYQVLGYSPTLEYKIEKPLDAIIVPGTVKITIDGQIVDSVDYTFVYKDGSFNINRKDLADPTSMISVQYEIRTVPESAILGEASFRKVQLAGKWKEVELLPKNYYGLLGYSYLNISPREWIAPRIGYTYYNQDAHLATEDLTFKIDTVITGPDTIDTDTGTVIVPRDTAISIDTTRNSANHIVDVAVPLEFRNSNFFLKFEPDFAYNASRKAAAGSLAIQSRLGSATSFIFNSLYTDKNFETTNQISRGYGNISRQLDFKVTHDIRKELPLSYMQEHIRARDGEQNRYQFDAGMHFVNIPYLDVMLSHTEIDAVFDTVSMTRTIKDTLPGGTEISYDTTYDTLASLDQNKDKIRLRLYETSSTFGQKILRLQNLSYDLSATYFTPMLFTSKRRENQKIGALYVGQMAITPISSITLSPIATMRFAPGTETPTTIEPQLYLQTIDAPPGLEINGQTGWKFATTDTGTCGLKVSRAIEAIVKPGRWWKSMGWFSPLLGLEDDGVCFYDRPSISLANFIVADRNRLSDIRTRILGVTIYPNDQILFKNENRWTNANDSLVFQSFNDLKVWVGANNDLWQTRWIINRNFEAERTLQNAFMNYERRWSSLTNTRTGVNFKHERYPNFTVAGTDTLRESLSIITLGPAVNVTLTSGKVLFVKKFLFSNYAAWEKEIRNGEFMAHPVFTYLFDLSTVVMPNINFHSTISMVVKEAHLESFMVNLRCVANF